MKFLTLEQIKLSEAKTITRLSTSSELINNAALACAKELMPFGAICVFCGKGNNAADGYRVASILKKSGKTVFAVSLFPPKTAECSAMLKECEDLGIEIFSLNDPLPPFDACVDAVFGIGFKGNIDGLALDAIRRINSLNKFTLSIDIPSGLNADSGKPMPEAVYADKTVTFTAPKIGMANGESADFCGEIVIKDVGVAYTDYDSMPIYPLLPTPLPRRSAYSHKGSFGKAVMFVGSNGMAGAAAMAAKAAMRSGCGLVNIVCPVGLESTLNIMVPEAVVVPVKEYALNDEIMRCVSSAKAILIGCGIGKSIPPEFILSLLQSAHCPVILDADALNALSPFPDQPLKGDIICTPHPLEFSRMTGIPTEDIEKNRIALATDFAAKKNLTLVLKGARTIVARRDASAYVSLISTSALAKGGSGDVLSGIICALCAQGFSSKLSARTGVYLHSLSGRITARQKGEYSATVSDIIDNLSLAFKEIST